MSSYMERKSPLIRVEVLIWVLPITISSLSDNHRRLINSSMKKGNLE